jgi:hypothetical protein
LSFIYITIAQDQHVDETSTRQSSSINLSKPNHQSHFLQSTNMTLNVISLIEGKTICNTRKLSFVILLLEQVQYTSIFRQLSNDPNPEGLPRKLL